MKHLIVVNVDVLDNFEFSVGVQGIDGLDELLDFIAEGGEGKDDSSFVDFISQFDVEGDEKVWFDKGVDFVNDLLAKGTVEENYEFYGREVGGSWYCVVDSDLIDHCDVDFV